ncbi:effector-associated domain EAD1-containing protein [Micromonospora sp. NPDC047187]|uniref:effector-associated domain EAD1-containing protein n=1 Tax=Micromonospora sp. NPDC047187 TaxID=3155262 RepID=UPI0033F02DF7
MAIDHLTVRLFSEALLDAFEPDRLKQMLFYRLGKRLDRITMARDYESIVFELIMGARSEGWDDKLVLAARQSRPSDARIFEVAQRLHLTVKSSSLESILNTRAPEIRPERFRAALAAAEGQVCRVERRTAVGSAALGTGFLVGPGLCLTGYHVVRGLFTGGLSASDVALRFDYKYDSPGGTVFGLAGDWNVAFAPASASEEQPGPADQTPALTELDFALLRVAGEPGHQPVGANAEPGAERRGWIEQVFREPLRSGDDLLVLHHMQGKPMQLSFGQVLEVNANGTRLRHSANTEKGSSGSPCFTLGMELAAIHQAGDPDTSTWHVPDHNRAVPAGAVFSTFPLL